MYCRQQEEPAILTPRLLLRMRHTYVVSICLESTEHNLITRVWTFYHSLSDHACFDHHICQVKLTQSTAMEQKRFDLRSIVVARIP